MQPFRFFLSSSTLTASHSNFSGVKPGYGTNAIERALASWQITKGPGLMKEFVAEEKAAANDITEKSLSHIFSR
jgi:hypothetical protein